MAQQGTSGQPPGRRYDETTDPRNPPRAVLNPRARSSALMVYLGGIVGLFVVVGIGLLVWPGTGRDLARVEPAADTHAIGTTGETLPGGFQPGARPGTTDAELERRGVDTGIGGVMPPLTSRETVTSLGELDMRSIAELVNRRLDIENVEVERVEGDSFWIRDNDTRARVLRPDLAVQPGSRVDVGGTIHQDADGALLIQATRVDVRH